MLKGLRIVADHEVCIACGTCVDKCFMGAITLRGEKIYRDNSLCKGCGLCISICPQNAISAEVEDIDEAVNEFMDRIGSIVDIG